MWLYVTFLLFNYTLLHVLQCGWVEQPTVWSCLFYKVMCSKYSNIGMNIVHAYYCIGVRSACTVFFCIVMYCDVLCYSTVLTKWWRCTVLHSTLRRWFTDKYNDDLWTIWCITMTFSIFYDVISELRTVSWWDSGMFLLLLLFLVNTWRSFLRMLVAWTLGIVLIFADVDAFARVLRATIGTALHDAYWSGESAYVTGRWL